MTEPHVETVDDLLAALQTELSVLPSREFAAGVRARIAARPARAPWRLWMVPVAVAAGVAAIAVVSMWGPVRAPREASRVVTTAPALERTVSSGTATGVRRVAPPPAPISTKRGRAVVATAVPLAPVEPARAEPEVLVPDDQRLALVNILGAMRSAPSRVPPALAVAVDADGRRPAPDTIIIPMIVIELLGPAPDWRRER
jgi:hypothetical protein